MDAAKSGDLDANTARVLLDGEKWLAAKRAPYSHADKVAVEHSGNMGGLAAVSISIVSAQRELPAVVPSVHDMRQVVEAGVAKLELPRGE